MILEIKYNYLKLLIIILIFSVSFVTMAASEADPERRAVLGINIANGQQADGPVEGVALVGIAPGGAAADAGLQVEDVLVEINGVSLMATDVRDANRTLLDFMADVAPGDELKIVYLRDGQAISASLIAGELDPTLMVEPDLPFMRDLERLGRRFDDDVIAPLRYRWRHHGLFAGMELVAMTPGLGRYFGTETGLLVIRAPGNEAIGLQDGDVIREIGGRRPQDPGHAMRILRSYEAGEEVVIGIVRDRKETEVVVSLPEGAVK